MTLLDLWRDLPLEYQLAWGCFAVAILAGIYALVSDPPQRWFADETPKAIDTRQEQAIYEAVHRITAPVVPLRASRSHLRRIK